MLPVAVVVVTVVLRPVSEVVFQKNQGLSAFISSCAFQSGSPTLRDFFPPLVRINLPYMR